MTFYEWRDELSVNVPSIDRQHQVPIGFMNDLHNAVGCANANAQAARILKVGAYHYPEDLEHKVSHQ